MRRRKAQSVRGLMKPKKMPFLCFGLMNFPIHVNWSYVSELGYLFLPLWLGGRWFGAAILGYFYRLSIIGCEGWAILIACPFEVSKEQLVKHSSTVAMLLLKKKSTLCNFRQVMSVVPLYLIRTPGFNLHKNFHVKASLSPVCIFFALRFEGDSNFLSGKRTLLLNTEYM